MSVTLRAVQDWYRSGAERMSCEATVEHMTGRQFIALCSCIDTSIPEGPYMHSTRMKTPGIALVVLCAASVLMLAAPKAVRADSRVQTAETSQEVSSVCAEQYRTVFGVESLGAVLATADQHVPEPHAAYRPQPKEIVRADLQVPTALWRTLLMEEGISRTNELRVPAALLATLSAEGGVQMPQRSQDLCGPFFSLY